MLKFACIALLALAAGARAMSGGAEVNDASTYSFQAAIQPIITGVTYTLKPCSGIIVKGLAASSTPTGTATDKYYILTAASCVISGTTFNLYLGTNEVQFLTAPDISGVTRDTVVFHPEFLTSGMQQSDLAIINADSITAFFTARTKSLTAASLPTISNSGSSFLTKSVNMAGWGYPSETFKTQAPRLRQLTSFVVPNFYCAVINYGKPVTSKHICTGGIINKGPCTGDAGAPLILRSDNRVIGLATLVPADGCNRSKPGVFTRLGSYLPWIMQTTNYTPDN